MNIGCGEYTGENNLIKHSSTVQKYGKKKFLNLNQSKYGSFGSFALFFYFHTAHNQVNIDGEECTGESIHVKLSFIGQKYAKGKRNKFLNLNQSQSYSFGSFALLPCFHTAYKT